MDILFVVIVLAILVIALGFRIATRPRKNIRPRHSRPATSPAARSGGSSTQWRAVKIAPGLMSCGAAGKLADRVYLSMESPRLPLDGCTEPECQCRYLHLEDRRDGSDRRMELGDLGAFLPITRTERRQAGGRRAEDLAA